MWKQGWIFKVLYPPYSQTSILNTRKPVEGLEYHEGMRSAYDSIRKRGGYIPPVIRRKMGVYGIEIRTTPDKRQPELKFRREEKIAYHGKKRALAPVARMPKARIVRFK